MRIRFPDERFDLIVSVLVLHHIPNLEPLLSGFASLSAEGGTLCAVDLKEDADGAFHRDRPGFEGHDGFARDDLAAQVEAAGFVDVRFTRCLDVEKAGAPFPLFLASAKIRPRCQEHAWTAVSSRGRCRSGGSRSRQHLGVAVAARGCVCGSVSRLAPNADALTHH